MSKTVWVWVPDDREKWGPARILQVGKAAPQPGRRFEVVLDGPRQAKQTALRLVTLAQTPQPDRKTDGQGYLDWLDAQERVTEVTGG